jgi:hypothetical protein
LPRYIVADWSDCVRKMLKMTAIALTALPGLAQAAETPCLTSSEFAGVAAYSLPSVITGTASRCAATLPANSYLRSNAPQLAARYAEEKPAAWPVAKAAFLKISATTDQAANGVIANLPDPSLQTMMDAVIEGAVSQHIPTERCATIDALVRVLAPLPPANTAELLALAVGIGAQSGKLKTGAFSICPA